MAATAPMMHYGCMLMYGGSTSAIAGIFYAAWAAHLLEACYSLVLLSRNGWLRTANAVPWFGLTCVRASGGHECLASAVRPRRARKSHTRAVPPGAPALRVLFGYPQLGQLLKKVKKSGRGSDKRK
jgi:hypothetical protein